MSFITQWIANAMEHPEQCKVENERALRDSYEGAKQLKEQWSEPFRPPQSWRFAKHHKVANLDRTLGGSDQKQSKYMYNATSRSNTYDSVLSLYHKVEQRHDK